MQTTYNDWLLSVNWILNAEFLNNKPKFSETINNEWNWFLNRNKVFTQIALELNKSQSLRYSNLLSLGGLGSMKTNTSITSLCKLIDYDMISDNNVEH